MITLIIYNNMNIPVLNRNKLIVFRNKSLLIFEKEYLVALLCHYHYFTCTVNVSEQQY